MKRPGGGRGGGRMRAQRAWADMASDSDDDLALPASPAKGFGAQPPGQNSKSSTAPAVRPGQNSKGSTAPSASVQFGCFDLEEDRFTLPQADKKHAGSSSSSEKKQVDKKRAEAQAWALQFGEAASQLGEAAAMLRRLVREAPSPRTLGQRPSAQNVGSDTMHSGHVFARWQSASARLAAARQTEAASQKEAVAADSDARKAKEQHALWEKQMTRATEDKACLREEEQQGAANLRDQEADHERLCHDLRKGAEAAVAEARKARMAAERRAAARESSLKEIREELSAQEVSAREAEQRSVKAVGSRNLALELPALRQQAATAEQRKARAEVQCSQLRVQVEAARAELATVGKGRVEEAEERSRRLELDCQKLQEQIGGSTSTEAEGATARSVTGIPSQVDYNNWNRELLGEVRQARTARDEAVAAHKVALQQVSEAEREAHRRQVQQVHAMMEMVPPPELDIEAQAGEVWACKAEARRLREEIRGLESREQEWSTYAKELESSLEKARRDSEQALRAASRIDEALSAEARQLETKADKLIKEKPTSNLVSCLLASNSNVGEGADPQVADFPCGAHGQISGLEGKPELNEQYCVSRGVNPENAERLNVLTRNGSTLSIKPANLRPAELLPGMRVQVVGMIDDLKYHNGAFGEVLERKGGRWIVDLEKAAGEKKERRSFCTDNLVIIPGRPRPKKQLGEVQLAASGQRGTVSCDASSGSTAAQSSSQRRVKLTGLEGQPELNGRVGTEKGSAKVKGKNRFKVHLDGTEADVLMDLKKENLIYLSMHSEMLAQTVAHARRRAGEDGKPFNSLHIICKTGFEMGLEFGSLVDEIDLPFHLVLIAPELPGPYPDKELTVVASWLDQNIQICCFRGRYQDFQKSPAFSAADVVCLSNPSLKADFFDWVETLHGIASVGDTLGICAGMEPHDHSDCLNEGEGGCAEGILSACGFEILSPAERNPHNCIVPDLQEMSWPLWAFTIAFRWPSVELIDGPRFDPPSDLDTFTWRGFYNTRRTRNVLPRDRFRPLHPSCRPTEDLEILQCENEEDISDDALNNQTLLVRQSGRKERRMKLVWEWTADTIGKAWRLGGRHSLVVAAVAGAVSMAECFSDRAGKATLQLEAIARAAEVSQFAARSARGNCGCAGVAAVVATCVALFEVLAAEAIFRKNGKSDKIGSEIVSHTALTSIASVGYDFKPLALSEIGTRVGDAYDRLTGQPEPWLEQLEGEFFDLADGICKCIDSAYTHEERCTIAQAVVDNLDLAIPARVGID